MRFIPLVVRTWLSIATKLTIIIGAIIYPTSRWKRPMWTFTDPHRHWTPTPISTSHSMPLSHPHRLWIVARQYGLTATGVSAPTSVKVVSCHHLTITITTLIEVPPARITDSLLITIATDNNNITSHPMTDLHTPNRQWITRHILGSRKAPIVCLIKGMIWKSPSRSMRWQNLTILGVR